ncbi:MAG: rhamnogalacturonan acetylesterase [Opitutaceae bacterium]|nr:rhamnogalacturonan acetylesterase [Opitutaceae bacterium]
MTRPLRPTLVSALAGVVLFLSASARADTPLAGPASVPVRVPRIHLAGDSTAADKPTSPPNPEHGWGQLLPQFLSEPDMVVNHAQNGRSTKSFIDEGRWQALVDALQPGDWVIIQFGHNDEKDKDPKRYTAPRDGYTENLRRFVGDVRGRGAHPVLCTPVARRKWDEAGSALVETHGDYPAAVRDLARAEGVPLFDLLVLTRALEEAHGVEGSKRLHLWIPAGRYERRPEGWQDDTHYSAYGAGRVAALVVQEILRQQLPLQAWVK